MKEDYKTKKNDWLSKHFVKTFIYNSEDVYCEPIHLLVSIPIWQNPTTPNLDFYLVL